MAWLPTSTIGITTNSWQRKTARWDQTHRGQRPTRSASTDVEHSIRSRHPVQRRRDATRLLAAVWAGTAANPPACAVLRGVMSQQVTQRLARAVPEGGTLEAKSGGLFGRVLNEIALITDSSGEAYSIAVLTRAHRPYTSRAAIGGAMSLAVAEAVEHLRIPSQRPAESIRGLSGSESAVGPGGS